MKKAFTLAEVLITLGIIGVIAAMTMPVVSAKVQDITLKNQFKKAFNTYSNAVQKVAFENGDLPGCFYSEDPLVSDNWGECTTFYNKLAEELNFVKYCNGNAFADGCVPQYDKYNAESESGACPGFTENIVKNTSKAWILTDGSIMFTYYTGYAPVFAVDINGLKKPNRGGYDLFVFKLTRRAGAISLGGNSLCGFSSPGGKTTIEMLNYVNK